MRKPLNEKEKRIGLAIAGATALLLIAVWAPALLGHSKAIKGTQPILYLGLGLALILTSVLAILRGNKLLAGSLCILVALGPWGKYIVLAFPILAFGTFVAFKRDPEAVQRQREAVAQRRLDRANGKTSSSAQPIITAGGKELPSRSKRYTPPSSARGKKNS